MRTIAKEHLYMFNPPVLVDADSLVFRLCCVTQNKNDIMAGLKRDIERIKKECISNTLYFAIKGEGNFRHKLDKNYKANRPELDADFKDILNWTYNYIEYSYNAIRADGMEADDLVSIWAHECIARGEDYIIAGIDKDLLQIPGMHYNYKDSSFEYVDEDGALYNLMLQCLTGDSADNIKGIKGIGPKKGARILAGVSAKNLWAIVQRAWQEYDAGDPTPTRDLLRMLTTWEEFYAMQERVEEKGDEGHRDATESETPQCEQDVHDASPEDLGVQELPTGDKGLSEGELT